MLSADLFTAITNKSILDQRFATDLNQQTNSILSDAAKWLRNTLYNYESIFGEPITDARKRRLEKLVETVESKLDEVYKNIDDLYIESFKSLAIEDAEFIAAAINEDLTGNLIMEQPSNSRLWAAVTQNPLYFPDNANSPYVDFTKMVKSLGEKSAQVASTISNAYFSGQTVQETVSQIVGTRKAKYKDGMIDKSRRDAEMVVRTATNHVTTQAKRRLFEDNSDTVYGYRIVATIDTRTSNICKYWDGKVIKYTARVQPVPPFHPNCLLPDTSVITCDGVSNVFKRAYKGIAVDISTESGFTLSVTPNHPILTSRGWVAAKDINRSDKLATITDSHVVIDNQKDSIEANISDLFSALEVSSNSRFIADRPTTTEHFHGDVTDANVSVINVDSLAWRAAKSILNKKVENKPFFCGFDSSLSSFGSFDFFGLSNFSTSGGDVSSSSKGFFSFCASSIHSSLLLFGSVSKCAKLSLKESLNWVFATTKTDMLSYTTDTNASIIGANDGLFFSVSEVNNGSIKNINTITFENPLDWLGANSKELPDFLTSKVVDGVKFDDVVNVSTRKVDTHVYNLENKNNWYIANGIITHNCRTTTVPEIYGGNLSDSAATRAVNFKARGSLKAGTVGQVSAQQTYLDVLKRQSAGQQNLALGEARAKIFRNAGLTTDEFRQALADNMGRPLTLAEMAKQNKKILEYMKQSKELSRYLDD